jgi:Rod binding domain-containing protein
LREFVVEICNLQFAICNLDWRNVMETSSLLSLPVMPPGMDLTAYARQGRPNDPRALDTAATGFESLFVSMLMKEMRHTLEEGSMFGQDKGDVLGGLFDHYLGQHLASAGALGIAAMVKKSWQAGVNHGQQPNTVQPNPSQRPDAGSRTGQTLSPAPGM